MRNGALYCPKCGKRVSLRGHTDPIFDTGVRCARCGAVLRSSARFCNQCGAPPTVESAGDNFMRSATGTLLPTQTVNDRYLVLEKVSQGGMGAIYKVQDQRLQGKLVALKEITEATISQDERQDVLDAFRREAELLARLRHPHLIRVTDLFSVSSLHYIVMEFIDGQTLEEMLDARLDPFPEEQVLNWARQLCSVLAYLHSQDPIIIYRDMKPANVMAVKESDEIKLIDFGIARLYKPGKKKDTIHFGTDGYAPPEQYGEKQTDARADVYALGATLHHLLTRCDPRDKPWDFPSVSKLNPTVSNRVSKAIAKAVQLDRDQRHQSVAEFWEALSGETLEGEVYKPDGEHVPEPAPPTPDVDEILEPLSLGSVTGGSRQTLSRQLSLPLAEDARIQTDVSWIEVVPESLSAGGGVVNVKVDTGQLYTGQLKIDGNLFKRWLGWHTERLIPSSRSYTGAVLVKGQSGFTRAFPVTLTVQPTGSSVVMGWGMTLMMLFGELGFPVLVVLAMLGLL